MDRYRIIAIVTMLAGCFFGALPALAKTTSFQNYHCADDTRFVVGFYPHDTSAYVHFLDGGGDVKLPKRLAVSGKLYSAARVTLRVSRSGRTTVKRPGRPETACELMSSRGS
jgi:membrane-bound inhibitor of C-type lysozyme